MPPNKDYNLLESIRGGGGGEGFAVVLAMNYEKSISLFVNDVVGALSAARDQVATGEVAAGQTLICPSTPGRLKNRESGTWTACSLSCGLRRELIR